MPEGFPQTPAQHRHGQDRVAAERRRRQQDGDQVEESQTGVGTDQPPHAAGTIMDAAATPTVPRLDSAYTWKLSRRVMAASDLGLPS